MQAPLAGDSNSAVLLLQQLAQLQHLVSQQPLQQQQQPTEGQSQQLPQQAGGQAGGKGPHSSSSSKRGAAAAGNVSLLASLDASRLQALARQLQQQRKGQQRPVVRAGSRGDISRVSSDLTQMLTLSVSASSVSEGDSAEDAVSVGGE